MTTLCHLDDIPDQQSKGFKVGDDNIFAVKKDGQVYIYRNSCPHLGVELNWQEDKFLDMDGMLIQCSTHGALFLIEDGACVSGPCQGQQLQAVEFEIVDKEIVLLP